jgi:ribosome-associated heat shock protein Hsp15
LAASAKPPLNRQRLDLWLFFARLAKSRSLAAKWIVNGHVRVNSLRIVTAAKPIQPGDVVTLALEREVRVVRILATGLRRGPASEAAHLFDDIGSTAGRMT